MAKNKLQIFLGLKDNASRKLNAVSSNVTATAQKMRTAGLVLATAGVAGILTLNKMTLSVIETSSELVKLSKATGIAATQLAGLGFAAEQEGGSIDAVSKALKKLSDSSRLAAQTLNNESRRAFDALGISASTTNGKLKNSQDILLEMADVLEKGNITAEKQAALYFLLGRGAQDIIPFIKGGSDAIKDQIAEYIKLTGVTDEMLQGFKEVGDEMTTMKAALQGIKIQLASIILPILRQLTGVIIILVRKFSELPDSLKILITTMTTLAPVILVVGGAALFLTAQLALFSTASVTAVAITGTLTAAMGILAGGLWAVVSPILVVLVAVDLLFRALALLRGAIAGVNEAWNRLRGNISQAEFFKNLRKELFTLAKRGGLLTGFDLIKDKIQSLADLKIKPPTIDTSAINRSVESLKGSVEGIKNLGRESFGLGDFVPGILGGTTGGGLLAGKFGGARKNIITIQVDSESKFGKEVMSFITSKGALAA